MTPKKKIGGGSGGRVISKENSLDYRASAKWWLHLFFQQTSTENTVMGGLIQGPPHWEVW